MSSFEQCNCLSPVLIISSTAADSVLKCHKYIVNGVSYTITNDHRYLVLNHERVGRVLHLPFLSMPNAKELSLNEYQDRLQRLIKFVDNSYFLNEDDGSMSPMYEFVPCGHCDYCESKKMYSYVQRCQLAVEESGVRPWFVTLTYNNEHLPAGYNVSLKDVQMFKKRFKRNIEILFDKDVARSVKFLVASEYSPKVENNYRPHYHMLIFGMPKFGFTENATQNEYYTIKLIQYCWRDSERKSNGRYVSFKDYRVMFPKAYKQPVGYDPLSFGYCNVVNIDGSSNAVKYVLKYAFKSGSHLDDLCKSEERSITCVQSQFEKYFCYSEDERDEFETLSVPFAGSILLPAGRKKPFYLMSHNLGLNFVLAHRNEILRDPQHLLSYCGFADGKVVDMRLSAYYLNKLFPSESKLVPVELRNAYKDVLMYSSNIVNCDWVPKRYKQMSIVSRLAVIERFPFLNLLEYDSHRSYLNKVSFIQDVSLLESSRHDLLTDHLQFLGDAVCKCFSYSLDYNEILKKVAERNIVLSSIDNRSKSSLRDVGNKYLRDQSYHISNSKL